MCCFFLVSLFFSLSFFFFFFFFFFFSFSFVFCCAFYELVHIFHATVYGVCRWDVCCSWRCCVLWPAGGEHVREGWSCLVASYSTILRRSSTMQSMTAPTTPSTGQFYMDCSQFAIVTLELTQSVPTTLQ